MTQALLDQSDIRAILEQQRSVQVPERVEGDTGKFGAFQDPAEIAALNIVDVERFAVELTKDQIVIFVCLSEEALVLSLFRAQWEEGSCPGFVESVALGYATLVRPPPLILCWRQVRESRVQTMGLGKDLSESKSAKRGRERARTYLVEMP